VLSAADAADLDCELRNVTTARCPVSSRPPLSTDDDAGCGVCFLTTNENESMPAVSAANYDDGVGAAGCDRD